MKELWFEGSSDDTFGLTNDSTDDYDNCASGRPIEWRVWSPSERRGLLVVGQYCPGSCDGWLIGVSRAPGADDDIDVPLPPWVATIIKGERSYSPRLVLTVPDDVEVDCLQRIEGERD